MERKEALKVISEKLKAGQTKKEIYKELLGKVRYKSDLVQYLALVPSHENRIKYRKLNLTLFSLLVFVSVSKLITGAFLLSQISIYALPFALLIPLISIFFAAEIWKFHGNMYRILGILGIADILKSLSRFEQFFTYDLQQIIIEIFFFTPSIIIIILALYIGTKVFPYYGFWGNLKEAKLGLSAEPAGELERV